MNWILFCVGVALCIYLVYNVFIITTYGVPKSLSETFYILDNKGWMFPIMITSIAGLLLPAWIELSNGTNFQFLAFLSASCLMFVGFAPAFKSNKLTDRVHDFSAYLSALFAILWICFVPKTYFVLIGFLILFFGISIITKTFKNAIVYWLEHIAIFSTFVSIIYYMCY